MSENTKDITELVLIIDRSGSMGGMESDTIGGINAVLEAHRQTEGQCVVTTVLFDDRVETLHDRLPLQDVSPLTSKEYYVRGCTALLDALGQTIEHIKRVQGYLPAEYRPKHTIFTITTDGLENASHHYVYEQVKHLIQARQEEGWEFLFLGANIDAAAEAARIGIPSDRAETYINDKMGSRAMYDSLAKAQCAMRSSSSRIGSEWSAPIQADRRRRRGLGRK